MTFRERIVHLAITHWVPLLITAVFTPVAGAAVAHYFGDDKKGDVLERFSCAYVVPTPGPSGLTKQQVTESFIIKSQAFVSSVSIRLSAFKDLEVSDEAQPDANDPIVQVQDCRFIESDAGAELLKTHFDNLADEIAEFGHYSQEALRSNDDRILVALKAKREAIVKSIRVFL